jgi:hypothetical protein
MLCRPRVALSQRLADSGVENQVSGHVAFRRRQVAFTCVC